MPRHNAMVFSQRQSERARQAPRMVSRYKIRREPRGKPMPFIPKAKLSTWQMFLLMLAMVSVGRAQTINWVTSYNIYVADPEYPSSSPINCTLKRLYSGNNQTLQTVTIESDNGNGGISGMQFLNVSNSEYTPILSFAAAQNIQAQSADLTFTPVIAKCSQSQGGVITPLACQQVSAFGFPQGSMCMDLSSGAVDCMVFTSPCIGQPQPKINIGLFSVNYNPDNGAFPVDGEMTLNAGENTRVFFSDKTAQPNNYAQVLIAQVPYPGATCSSRAYLECYAANSTKPYEATSEPSMAI